MGRDKLLTIRIEESKRESFNKWCESRDYSYSKFLYEVIEACLSGSIDESILSGESVDNNLADKLLDKINQVDKSLDERIEKKLVNDLDKNIDNRIAECIDQKLASGIDEKVNLAVNRLREELVPIINAEKELQDLLEKQKA